MRGKDKKLKLLVPQLLALEARLGKKLFVGLLLKISYGVGF